MKFITENQFLTHLKVKKELALFVGTGKYFEDKTFDWIKVVYSGDQIKCTLIRSFDEGDEYSNDVSRFSTLNQLEDEIDNNHQPSTSGDVAHCLMWLKDKFRVDTNKFILTSDLNQIYTSLVEDGKLGR